MFQPLLNACRRCFQPAPDAVALASAKRLAYHMTAVSPKPSFSQCGEDLIVRYYCQTHGLPRPTFLDIGAFDPWMLSNTALFYLEGSHGLIIEPNTARIGAFASARPRDICVNMGVADRTGSMTYYQFDAETLNTFSAGEAQRLREIEGHRQTGQAEVAVDTLPQILARYWHQPFPDFLSLDVEGSVHPILDSLKNTAALPKIMCVETISYSQDADKGVKDARLIAMISSLGFQVYADTHINTIFVQ